MKETRPIIKIDKEPFDQTLYTLGIFALIVLIAYPIFYYGTMPEPVPTHFNASGKPDNFGGKWTIFIIPLIGLGQFFFFNYLLKVPHKYNYPVKITAENAAFQYRNSVRMIQFLQATLTITFAWITVGSVNIALGKAEGLGETFLLCFVSAIVGGIIYFAYRSASKGR